MNILMVILWSFLSAVYTNSWWMFFSIENMICRKIGFYGIFFGSLIFIFSIFIIGSENEYCRNSVERAAPFIRFLLVSLSMAIYTSAWWMAFSIEVKVANIIGATISLVGTFGIVIWIACFIGTNWEKIWEMK